MPWRVRKSIRITKGLHINFGKRGTSLTVGGKGFHKTYGHGKVRTTIGLPGTGISYTRVKNRHKHPQTPSHTHPSGAPASVKQPPSQAVSCVSVLIAIFIVGGCIFFLLSHR